MRAQCGYSAWVRRPLVVLAPVAALVTACSLLAPVSSLRAGDGGASGDGGGADTGGLDAPATDGRTTDGARGGFCATAVHAVCEDFESGAPPLDWKSDVCNGCGLTVTSASSTSPPYALETKLPRRDPGLVNPTFAMLRRSFAGAWKHTRVELDLFVRTPQWQPGDVNAGVVCVQLTSSTLSDGFCVSVGEQYVSMSGFGAAFTAPQLAWEKWHHVVVEVDTAGGTASLLIDGMPQTQKIVPVVPGQSPETDVTVGIHGYNQPSPELVVLYDNVTIDFP